MLVPLLAACSSTSDWSLEPMTDATRPALLRELRNPLGGASVVVGDRCYVVHEPAAQREIRAFASALADAVESQDPHEPEPPPPGNPSIVALPWTSEAITMTTMGAELVRTDRGTVIYAWGLLEPNTWITAAVRGTEATTTTWAELAATVREHSTTWICGPTYMAMGRGYDLRGVGGPGLRK